VEPPRVWARIAVLYDAATLPVVGWEDGNAVLDAGFRARGCREAQR
jgi:hypothetical protein